MRKYFKDLDKEQKPVVLLSFLLALMALFFMPFLFSAKTSAETATIPMGYSSAQSVAVGKWGTNVKLLQRMADQLGVSYQECSQEELSKALLKVDSTKLAQVKELNLSGLGITELPEAMIYFTGLEKLDISSNQLTTLPDSLRLKENLEINADFNIFPESYGYPLQYHLYVLNVEAETYQQMALTDEYSAETLESIAKSSLWFETSLESGGVSVAEPNESFRFSIVPDSLQDAEGHPLSYFVSESTGAIFRQGTLSGAFYLTNEAGTLESITFPFTVELLPTDTSFTDKSIWKGKDALVKDLLAQTGAATVEDLPSRQLATLTELTLSPKGLEQLPDMLPQFPQVKKVILHEKADVSILKEMPQIEELAVTDASLTEVPAGLLDNSTILAVDLSGNNLPITILAELSTIPSLQKLTLERCGFSVIPENIIFPESLKSISLKDNQITTFPKILLMHPFDLLDLSYNQLSQLPGEVQIFTKEHKLLVAGNLLDERYEDQRHLIFKDPAASNFSVIETLEPMKLLGKSDLITLSDNTPISNTLSLVFRQKNGLSLLGTNFFSDSGIVLSDTTIEAQLQVANVENNSNAALPITLTLETTSKGLTSYEHELADQLTRLPESEQSLITEMTDSSLTEVTYTSQEPETMNALLFKTLRNSGKTFSYAVKESEGLTYQWTFSASQVKEALPLNPAIHEGSLFDAEIGAVVGNKPVTTLTFDNHGTLAGNALVEITFPDGQLSGGSTANAPQYLYLYDENTGELSYEGKVYVAGNTATFAINHTSIYVISPSTLSNSGTFVQKTKSRSITTEQVALFFSILLLLFVGVFGIGRSISLMGPTTERPSNREFISYLFAKKEVTGEDQSVEKGAETVEEIKADKKVTIDKDLLLQNEMYSLPRYMSSSTTTSLPKGELLEQVQDMNIDFSKYFRESENVPEILNMQYRKKESNDTMEL